MKQWYVAYVRSCQERTVSAALNKLGIETYIPVQKEWRRYSDRKVLKDRLVIPRVVFVRCEEAERLKSFDFVPYISHYMSDRVSHTAAVIPDSQMDKFRLVVSGSKNEVHFCDTSSYLPGETLEIISGPFKGMACEVTSIKNKTFLCVKIGLLGSAITEIDADSVKKADDASRK